MIARVLCAILCRCVDDQTVEPVLVQLGYGLLLHGRSGCILGGKHVVVVIAVVAVVSVSAVTVPIPVTVSSIQIVVIGCVRKVLVVFAHFLLVLIRGRDHLVDHHQQPDVITPGGNRIVRGRQYFLHMVADVRTVLRERQVHIALVFGFYAGIGQACVCDVAYVFRRPFLFHACLV